MLFFYVLFQIQCVFKENKNNLSRRTMMGLSTFLAFILTFSISALNTYTTREDISLVYLYTYIVFFLFINSCFIISIHY